MNILYVATYPSAGMIPFACSIVNHMAKAGNLVVFLSVSNGEMSYRTGIREEVINMDLEYPVSFLGKIRHHFLCDHFCNKIREVIAKYNIEIVHFLTGEYGMAIFYTRKLLNKTCLVYTVHDLEQHPGNGTMTANMYNRYFYAMTLRNIGFIKNLCTCSRRQKQQLRLLYPSKNIGFHHFPSLVTSKMKEGYDVCPELRGEKGYILFWGTFAEYKGVDLLYNAYLDSKLVGKKKLVMAGMGRWFFPRREDEQGIIRIDRFIQDCEVASLFKNCDFVVYPYIQITMSGVMTVAHYFHKRIIASDLDFFKDNQMAGDFLFRCGDKWQLINAMEKMSSEMPICQQYDERNFDIAQEMMEFYKACI